MNQFNKTVKEISELTEINDHCEALVLGAKLLKLSNLRIFFEQIQQTQIRQGYLTSHQAGDRHKNYTKLIAQARSTLTNEEYKSFYSAF